MWKEEIISKQDSSTRALMLAQNARAIDDDNDYISKIKLTPIIKDAQCVKEDGSVDLNVRPIYDENGEELPEIKLAHEARSRSGQRLHEIRRDKPIRTITDEKKERASNAFMERFTLDAIKERFKKLMKDMFKPTHAEIMAEGLKKMREE